MKRLKHPDFYPIFKITGSQRLQGIIIVLLLTGLSLFSATQSIGQTTSWKGTVNTNWSASANWTNGVPTATTDAIIGDAHFTGPYQPNLSSVSTCRSLTIGNETIAAELTTDRVFTIEGDLIIGSNGSLKHTNNSITLKGNWTNNGSYTTSQSSANVVFAGVTQAISGTTTFRKLTVNAGSSVSLQSNITVTANLTVNGTFDPNTYLVTLSGSLFSVNAGATIKVKGATFASNYSINPTINSTGTVDYASSSINQTIAVLSYGTLKISGGMTKSLAGNTTTQSSTSLAGNVNIVAGTLDMGTFTLTGARPPQEEVLPLLMELI
jgi:fibronectin-binding autotransporter adhesin